MKETGRKLPPKNEEAESETASTPTLIESYQSVETEKKKICLRICPQDTMSTTTKKNNMIVIVAWQTQ